MTPGWNPDQPQQCQKHEHKSAVLFRKYPLITLGAPPRYTEDTHRLPTNVQKISNENHTNLINHKI